MTPVTVSTIQDKIYLIRNQKVMIDNDLAELYGVQTGMLNRAVKRNKGRFPGDFMFQLTTEETQILISQIGISSPDHGGRRTNPYAFTEQGVAMLSSVLRSKKAVQVNISIMRAFVAVRRLMIGNEALAQAIEELQAKDKEHDKNIKTILQAIKQLMDYKEVDESRRIGYDTD